MTTQGDVVLLRLTGTVVRVQNATDDMRGRKVKDKSGKNFGRVHDVFVDDRERKARFLLVDHGGFFGVGEEKSFIPVDVIARTTSDDVCLEDSADHIAGAPSYDPHLVSDRDYQGSICSYYGCTPYWSANYVYPGFNS